MATNMATSTDEIVAATLIAMSRLAGITTVKLVDFFNSDCSSLPLPLIAHIDRK